MLVWSRRRDESIIIGEGISVTIVDIRGDKVRLGIDAPSEIPVHRREVYDAIQRENLRVIEVDKRKGLGGPGNPNTYIGYLPKRYESPQLPGENLSLLEYRGFR